jgi:hypothetical protein
VLPEEYWENVTKFKEGNELLKYYDFTVDETRPRDSIGIPWEMKRKQRGVKSALGKKQTFRGYFESSN